MRCFLLKNLFIKYRIKKSLWIFCSLLFYISFFVLFFFPSKQILGQIFCGDLLKNSSENFKGASISYHIQHEIKELGTENFIRQYGYPKGYLRFTETLAEKMNEIVNPSHVYYETYHFLGSSEFWKLRWNGPLNISLRFFQALMGGFFDGYNNLKRKNGKISFQFDSHMWLEIEGQKGFEMIVGRIFEGNETKAKEILGNLLTKSQLEETGWLDLLRDFLQPHDQALPAGDQVFKAIADLVEQNKRTDLEMRRTDLEIRRLHQNNAITIANFAEQSKRTDQEIRRTDQKIRILNQNNGSINHSLGIIVENLIEGGLFNALSEVNMQQSGENGRILYPIIIEQPLVPIQFKTKDGFVYRSKKFDIFVVVRQKNETGETIVKILVLETKTDLKREHLVTLKNILMNRNNVENITNYVKEYIQDSDLPFGLGDNDPIFNFDFKSKNVLIFAGGAYLKTTETKLEEVAQNMQMYLMKGEQSSKVEIQNPNIIPVNFFDVSALP